VHVSSVGNLTTHTGKYGRNDVKRLEVSLHEHKFIWVKRQRVTCLRLACSHTIRRQIYMDGVAKSDVFTIGFYLTVRRQINTRDGLKNGTFKIGLLRQYMQDNYIWVKRQGVICLRQAME
jgi:hypothetical protein